MSFFRSEDESEDEKIKKSFGFSRANRDTNRILKTFTEVEKPELDTELQLLSEEQELRELRKHSRYQTYAASTKREQESLQPRNTAAGSDGWKAEEVQNNDQEFRTHMPHWVERKADELHGTKALQRSNESELNNYRKHQRKRRKINPGIDPKIIDDSSSDGTSESDEETLLGPALPQLHSQSNPDAISQESIPHQKSVKLGSPHSSYVTGITIDNAGNRLVSVSLDSHAKMWDFNSMNSNMIPFRTFSPLGDSPLRTIECSRSGGQLLCSGRANSAIVMDREGSSLAQTMQGDMYIIDAGRTKGHTASIAAAKWHPHQSSNVSQIITTSLDGTIRVWDINRTSRKPMTRIPVMTQLSVRRLRSRHGGRIIATAFDWLHGSYSAAFGCSDGTIKVLDIRSSTSQPAMQSASDTRKGEEITGVCCSPSSKQPFVLARSTDDCLRVYDSRLFKEPVITFNDLPNSISETNVCFLGPSEDIFATGTSTRGKTGGPPGSIRMFSVKELKQVMRIESHKDTGSVIYIMWKESLNQIIAGTGSGDIVVYYDTVYSHRGVLNCLKKTASRKREGLTSIGAGIAVSGSSFIPKKGKIPMNALRMDTETLPKQTGTPVMKPNSSSLPVRNLGKSSTLAQHLAKQEVSKEWSRDPREALLQFADIANKDPRFTKVYKTTQPLPVLAEKTAEEEEEESRKAIYDRDRLRKFRKHPDSDPH